MIFNTRYIILLVLLIGFSYQSCKKYENGPLISFISKTERLTGYWESDVIYIDNEEWEIQSGAVFYEINKDGTYHKVFESGTWTFDEDKEKLIFTSNIGDVTTMEILRLTKKELWLQDEQSDKIYEYRFIKSVK